MIVIAESVFAKKILRNVCSFGEILLCTLFVGSDPIVSLSAIAAESTLIETYLALGSTRKVFAPCQGRLVGRDSSNREVKVGEDRVHHDIAVCAWSLENRVVDIGHIVFPSDISEHTHEAIVGCSTDKAGDTPVVVFISLCQA